MHMQYLNLESNDDNRVTEPLNHIGPLGVSGAFLGGYYHPIEGSETAIRLGLLNSIFRTEQ